MNPATQIESEAADWLARRDTGGWSPDDEKTFDQWIGESTAHRVAYLRLQSVWTKADRLRILGRSDHLVTGKAVNPVTGTGLHFHPRRTARWLGGGLAAASAAAAALFLLLGSAAQYSTPIGGFQRVPLADGSRIELNTDTKIEVSYGDDERRIELDQGEAFFDVASNKRRPFIVEAGRYRIIAVGTAFSVRIKGDDLDVLVTEGRVRIERDDLATRAASPMFVSAGHTADIKAGTPVVSPVAEASYDHQLGWRQGTLVFDNLPLREVTAEFNRYNRQQLVVIDPDVGAIAVSGTFRPTNLAGLTRLLQPGFGIEAVPAGENRILLRRAK